MQEQYQIFFTAVFYSMIWLQYVFEYSVYLESLFNVYSLGAF